MANPPISAAVLAGGRARRLGGALKPTVLVGGREILARQLDVLVPLASAVAVVVATDTPPKALSDYDIERLTDREPGRGPLEGIATALAWSPTDWLLCVAGDMPLICAPPIEFLRARADGLAVAFSRGDRVEPLFALYHRDLLGSIDDRIRAGDRSLQSLFRGAGAHPDARVIPLADIGDDDTFLTNVNSEQDIARAERSARP